MNLMYCFGCGYGGNVFDYVKDYENISFKEALSLVAEVYNLEKTGVKINKNLVDKYKQSIMSDKYLELMDTPGILLPKFENHKVALNLALIGTIKEDILPLEEVFEYLISFIKSYYISNFNNRFNVNITKDTENDEIINEIAKKRGYFSKGNVVDKDKTIKIILNEFRNGKLGQISIERVEDVNF